MGECGLLGQALAVSQRAFTPGPHILPACVSAFRIPCEDAEAFNRKGWSPRAHQVTSGAQGTHRTKPRMENDSVCVDLADAGEILSF